MTTPETQAASASAVLSTALGDLIEAVRGTAARVRALPLRGGTTDERAVHDFRVALRRLRTALRPARRLWGKRAIRRIGADLAVVATSAGDLRDEEVLGETLLAVELPEPTRMEVGRWLERRSARLRTLRATLVRGLRSATGPGEVLEHTLRALTRRLEKPKRNDVAMRAFRTKALAEACDAVHERRDVDPSDATAMHALRIRCKRARYVADLWLRHDRTIDEGERARLERISKSAARLQKKLGELHDLDDAKLGLWRAWGLDAAHRKQALSAIEQAREQAAERAVASIRDELASFEEPTRATAERYRPS